MLLLSITVCSVFATTTNKKEELIQKKQGRVPHGRHDFRNGLETDVLDRGSIEKIRGKLPQKNLSVGDTYEECEKLLTFQKKYRPFQRRINAGVFRQPPFK
ncbi:hypothetical protein Y032_0279g1192 [Ancylostoma ceylanicum]|uniref:Uncharacterized protein n=1 Tax=Ancylostoma ceylanicum TaxID=53326 RepID=A0A016S820_9BILA|nr:hypothetical protein Y032_0279g1192 [Ancylostoma ceylanicum]